MLINVKEHGISVDQLGAMITEAFERGCRMTDKAAAVAYFALTSAPEIYGGELSIDSIRSAWINAYGESEELKVTERVYGIYRFRAEIKNNNVYRIAYFTDCYDDMLLECCMEIPNPSKKKKLVDVLPPLFEQFAFRCRKKS